MLKIRLIHSERIYDYSQIPTKPSQPTLKVAALLHSVVKSTIRVGACNRTVNTSTDVTLNLELRTVRNLSVLGGGEVNMWLSFCS